MMIQIFFLVISFSFGLNATFISQKSSTFSNIALFFIVTFGAIIIRPWALKILYKFAYEPYSRVEDYIDYQGRGSDTGKSEKQAIVMMFD